MNRTLSATLFSILIILHFTVTAGGATIQFDGQSGSDWQDRSNWEPDTLPGGEDFVSIRGLQAKLNSGDAAAGFLDVRENGSLEVAGGKLSFGNANNRWLWVGWNSPGAVVQTGGIVESIGRNIDLIVDDQGRYDLLAGQLRVADDLRLYGNAQFNLAGTGQLIVGDDLRVAPGSTAEFNLILEGDGVPTIEIGDDLVLRNGVSVHIDTTNWTGGAEPLPIFQVAGRISGQPSEITINGRPVPAEDYLFTSNSLIVTVPEGHSQLLTFVCLGLFCRRRLHRLSR